jgi:NitT/TauT family transport system permease protein
VRRRAAIATSTLAVLAMAGAWQVVAVFGGFPPKLFPDLGSIARAFVTICRGDVLTTAVVATMYRLLAGFAIATLVGVPLGLLMGRYRWIEETTLPLVSFLNPIPGVAYAPLFILWFGLGDLSAILLVGLNSALPIIVNVWAGAKSVSQIWVRSAEVMGANRRQLFWRVVIPASFPHILTGLRVGLSNAWRILIAVEMILAVSKGLGWMIFGAQEFLNTDVMLATIIVIALIGIALEALLARVENVTVVRWGMMK